MGASELKARIEKFKQEYLDTPVGRAHYETELKEQVAVQAIYQDLQTRYKSGEDVTNAVLEQLLPYADTKGNRERGVRISTWPCVTKDIRTWFENVGWKKPADWPEVARWLLEIAEAGRAENWAAWENLAKKQVQKGFQDGFVSPIVHCLNPDLPVINNKVVATFADVANELGLKTEINRTLIEYPGRHKTLLDLIAQLKPLGLHNLQQWDVYCHWNIAKTLGGGEGLLVIKPPQVSSPPVAEVTKLPPVVIKPSETAPNEDNTQALIEELKAAQNDTKNPTRFEIAVAAAFNALGFEAQHIGGPGKADVVASAYMGDETFSLVIDPKTSQPGIPRTNLNYPPIKTHQEENAADYALVAAEGFSGGDTVTFAVSQKVGLLETKLLVRLVEESGRAGLSLYKLKEIFSQVGLLAPKLDEYLVASTDMYKGLAAVLEVFEQYQRKEETETSLEAKAIQMALKVGKNKVPPSYIQSSLELLANPLVGILEKRGDGYVMVLPASLAYRRFQVLSQSLTGLIIDL